MNNIDLPIKALDAAAKALYESGYMSGSWEGKSPFSKSMYRKRAKASIIAFMENLDE